jgi:Flp pilus assembly protein TadD
MKILWCGVVCGLMVSGLAAADPAANVSANFSGSGDAVRSSSAAPGAFTTGQNASELYAKGVARFQAGDYEGAETAMRKVLRMAPKDANALYVYGMSFYAQSDYDAAVEQLRKSVRINDTNYDAQAKLGLSYVKLGRLDDASGIRSSIRQAKSDCGAACADAEAMTAAVAELSAALEQ